MRLTELREISRMSAPEKILLIEDLWDSVASDESCVPIPDSHVRELDRRRSSPGTLLTLKQLQAAIANRMCPSSSLTRLGFAQQQFEQTQSCHPERSPAIRSAGRSEGSPAWPQDKRLSGTGWRSFASPCGARLRMTMR
ncbi:MAG: addiction module protein [Planctomycetes bacterium]|nr:addiction module protein [Planctomycetota bacterium]